MKNGAISITREEWKEISLLPEVQLAFNNLTFIDLPRIVYGAKYVYPDSEYEGTVYTLVGAYNGGVRTIILERKNDVLKVVGMEVPGDIL